MTTGESDVAGEDDTASDATVGGRWLAATTGGWIDDHCTLAILPESRDQAEGIVEMHTCIPPCPHVVAAHHYLRRLDMMPEERLA